MGRFYGLLIFLLLPYIDEGLSLTDTPLEPCPANKVCVNFVFDYCWNREYDVYDRQGVLWDGSITCDDAEYHSLYASLVFELKSSRLWSVTVSTVEPADIQQVEFSFANAELKFTPDTAILEWRSAKKTRNAKFPMKPWPGFSPGPFRKIHYRYSFDISADGEKLINLLGGSNVVYTSQSYGKITLNNGRFLDRLKEKTICDLEDINRTCYGDCNELTSANRNVVCSSKLWFRDPGEDQQWKMIDSIKCQMASWLAEWSGASQTIDSSIEIQCSAMKPGTGTSITKKPKPNKPATTKKPRNRRITTKKPTNAAAEAKSKDTIILIVCIVISGLVLLIIAVICVGVFLWKRKKNGRKDTIRGSNSKAQTPKESKKSGSTKEKGNHLSMEPDIDAAFGTSGTENGTLSRQRAESNKEKMSTKEKMESKERIPSYEAIESKEPIESKEKLESKEIIPSYEAIESKEPIESKEKLESKERIESHEAIESKEPIESNEKIESKEPTALVKNGSTPVPGSKLPTPPPSPFKSKKQTKNAKCA